MSVNDKRRPYHDDINKNEAICIQHYDSMIY